MGIGSLVKLRGAETEDFSIIVRYGMNPKVFRVEPALIGDQNWYIEDELEEVDDVREHAGATQGTRS